MAKVELIKYSILTLQKIQNLLFYKKMVNIAV